MTTESSPVRGVFESGTSAQTISETTKISSIGTYSTIAILSVAFIVWNLLSQARKDPKTRNIPKGPRGWPIVGSFFALTAYPELTLTNWQNKYGPIFSMTLGSQLFVVLGDQGYAKELLVTNGKDFSSRKPMFVKSQLIMKGGGITTTPYGDRWRQHRRVAATMLDPASVERLTPTFDKESIVFLKSLLDYGKAGTVPIDPRAHAGRFTLNNTLHIVFGTRTESREDPLVQTALKISREFMNCTGPLTNLIDYVDFLQKIPTPMRSRGIALHNAIMTVYGGMIKEVERKMSVGEDVPECFTKNLLLCREEEGFSWTDICTLVGGFMIGGVETTSSVVQWFLALLPNYPEVQTRAHAEIDAVVGRDRLPMQHDWENLPYCRAIIKEVQRTRNPFWLSTPHYSTADYTTQAGEFIPKGTVIILNCYAIHHNPKYYPDPYAFNPDRYVGDSNTVGKSMNQSDPYKRDHWTYGAGRRVCPGYQVAERELWLALSRILWAFKLDTIPDDPIDLKEYDGKSGRSPVPFRIRVTPRHDNVASVLDAAQSYEQ